MHVIAIYARASRDQTERRISTDRQVDRCAKLAEDLFPGAEVRVYRDDSLSGADPTVDRPGYNALVAAIRRGEVAEVVCHEQSRLTRRPEQWEQLLIILTTAGIGKVHTVQAGTVAVNEGNRLLGRFKALLDAEEVERVRARQLATHKHLAEEGRPNGGPVYGYKKVVGEDGRAKLVIDPDTSAVIRRICDRVLTGYSLSSIAEGLEADGIPAPYGGTKWHRSVVKRAVQKASVAGLRQHRGEIVGPAKWDPIIEPERWQKVLRALGSQSVLDAKGRPHFAPRSYRPNGRRWLLTGGLARCGKCDGPMKIGSDGHNRVEAMPAYMCRNAETGCYVSVAPAALVEELVVSDVLGSLDDPEIAKRLTDHPDPERAALLRELHRAQDDMSHATDLRTAGALEWSDFEILYGAAKARADAARGALAALPDPDIELPTAELIKRDWDQMPLRQKRALLERFVEAVVILPAAKPGRTKLSVTVTERVRARLDPDRGGGIRWRE